MTSLDIIQDNSLIYKRVRFHAEKKIRLPHFILDESDMLRYRTH